MASMRRSLSQQFFDKRAAKPVCDPLSTTAAADADNKICNLLPSQTSASPCLLEGSLLSQVFSLFPLALLRPFGMAERSSKTKASVWRKILFQFGICFAVGLCLGFFAPYKWPASVPDSSSVESKDFVSEGMKVSEVANALEETSVVTKARDVVGVDKIVNLTRGLGTSEVGSGPNATALQEPHKLLIVVTPTYTRPFKAYYLTRLAHTLKLVPPPFLWLVVEMQAQSLETAALLRETGIMYRHLVCEKNLTNVKDRGTYQRNVALAHIEQHQLDGIVYFADDDNVYTLELFEQLRQIKRFGTWLVGMLAHSKSRTILEGPVCDGEKVIGWHTNEKSKRLRRFHVDMSGFAFNSTILWDPRRWHRPTLDPIRQLNSIKEGFQETTFIEQLVADESQMEGRPPGCSKVMVWHLHLEAPPGFPYPAGWTLTSPLPVNLPLHQEEAQTQEQG